MPVLLRLRPLGGLLGLLVLVIVALHATVSQAESETPLLNTNVHVGSIWADVKSYGCGKTAMFRWMEGHKKHTQELALPPPWYVWTLDEDVSYLPNVMPWRILGRHTLIIIGTYLSAAYGVRSPLIFSLRNHRWKLIEDPELLLFTNRGGFYVKGVRLYVWDYEMNPEQAHSAAQRYWLKVFSLRHGRLYLMSRRLTRHRYLGGEDLEYEPPRFLPPKSDPLREFGLRWHWWGD